MRNLFVVCFIVLVFSNLAYSKFLVVPLDERVRESHLIVIGTLQSVSENKTEEIDYSKGTLVIEKVLSGSVRTRRGFSLKQSDKILVEWQNSNTIACRLGFSENERGIWFLQIDVNGKIESLSPGSNDSMSELAAVKKLLKRRSYPNKAAKTIYLQEDEVQIAKTGLPKQTSEAVKCPLYSEHLNQKQYSFFQAFLVILVSISLYLILYRSRFKIR